MIKTAQKISLFILSLIIAGSIATGAMAGNTTPSHVYQVTEELLTTLKSLGQIDEKIYDSYMPDHSLRHPRHVLQKARECNMLVSKILKDNGITPLAFPERARAYPVRFGKLNAPKIKIPPA